MTCYGTVSTAQAQHLALVLSAGVQQGYLCTNCCGFALFATGLFYKPVPALLALMKISSGIADLLCCPVSHLGMAWHAGLQEKVEARNADYAKIARHLHFHNVPTDKPQQQLQNEAADCVVLPGNNSAPAESFASPRQRQQQQQQQPGAAVPAAGSSSAILADEDWGAGMKDAEFLVWLGDFNYRVDAPEGFVPDRLNPDRPVNEQLYQFVLQKVRAVTEWLV